VKPALLDTDILSEVLKRRDERVQARAISYLSDHGQLTFSAITRYEVIRGLKELGAKKQRERFAAFCEQSTVVSLSESIFDRAADLWAEARRSGHPQSDADLLIAATALETGHTLVTGNTAHFEWISGLTLDNWRLE